VTDKFLKPYKRDFAVVTADKPHERGCLTFAQRIGRFLLNYTNLVLAQDPVLPVLGRLFCNKWLGGDWYRLRVFGLPSS